MTQIAKEIIFTGRVQGVGFRFTAFDIANRHQLTGQVRNMPNGSVEMIAQGPPDEVDSCIQNIKASLCDCIKETKTKDIPLNPSYKDFKITF